MLLQISNKPQKQTSTVRLIGQVYMYWDVTKNLQILKILKLWKNWEKSFHMMWTFSV